jgi:O-antigen ligase
MTSERPDVPGLLAQALLFASVILAPWAYGCAQEGWRFALAAVLLLACALWWSGAAAREPGVARLWLAAMGLPAVGLLQVALGTSASRVATLEAVVQVLACLAALVVFAEISREHHGALRLAAVLLVSAAAQGVFGIVQAAVAPKTIYGLSPAVAQMPFGSYVNHNHFAGLIEMAVPLAIGWALGLWRRGNGPTPGSIALGGLGLGLAATQLAGRSRGGLVALTGAVASLGLLWWIRYHRRERRSLDVIVAGVACATVLAFAWLAAPPDARQHLLTVSRGATDSSGSYRFDIARATLRLAVSRPWIGAGLGAYADAVPAFKLGQGEVRTTHAESDALQFLAEVGLLGVVVCAALALALLRCARRRVAARGDPVRRGVTLGALAGVIGISIHSFMDFNLHIPANALFFAGLVGLCGAPMVEISSEREEHTRRARWAVGLCVFALVLASLAAGWRAWGAWSFDRAVRSVSPRERLAALGGVLRYHPYLADAYRERARARMILAASGSLTAARLGRAEQDINATLRLRPLWAQAWADRGWILWMQGSKAKARQTLGRALELDPTHQGIRDLASRLAVLDGAADRNRTAQ